MESLLFDSNGKFTMNLFIANTSLYNGLNFLVEFVHFHSSLSVYPERRVSSARFTHSHL